MNLAHEDALVEYDGAPATPARIGETLRSLGYTIRDRERLRAFLQAEGELEAERRRLLVAVLVSGVGLTMMASEWLGSLIVGPWLAIAMALAAALVVFGLGSRFLAMALAALRHRILNQHVLLACRALGAFAAGLVGVGVPWFPAADFFGAAAPSCSPTKRPSTFAHSSASGCAS